MLIQSWNVGAERQQELLREAEKWREVQRLPRAQRTSHIARIVGLRVGKSLIAVGRFLAQNEPEPEVEVRLKPTSTL